MSWGPAGPGAFNTSGHWQPVSTLAIALGVILKGPVTDKTGLTGLYDFALTCNCDPHLAPDVNRGAFAGLAEADHGPDPIAAVRDQLGLKLEAKIVRVDVLVVDRLEQSPSKR